MRRLSSVVTEARMVARLASWVSRRCCLAVCPRPVVAVR